MERYKESIPEQKARLFAPVIADIKKPELKKEEKEKENSEKSLEAVIKTLFASSMIWLPWLMFRERMREAQ